ncbi:class I SAM-dependent methyltransferase [Stieleria varia]|uniref:Bifunctional 3-demethylubiquinone-9 3-methyltransferase/ 2-octaprenyl-6-hydroxy phenol methylase n=1 Tax=Stieleria varia TaxID=2528005 RepID=A0A5C6A3P7_9BACT|nr:class I SAM-dependent methyltransferase [Stieleria varia]TWT93831.1 bifunctional 3-demethylubiquinone-9 3-methyltransferase/ 2-octaprenyl-6-hydroxy phenol methylase [Stieleria varia]
MSTPVEPTEFNRIAWDNIATSRHRWFEHVSDEAIERARDGDFDLRLTACKSIPRQWIGDIMGRQVLCLAAGGGHQAPLLAAAGAQVTVVDFSESQLAIDRRLADKHSLALTTVQADMANLSVLGNEQFDLIVNPCSVNFCPDARVVWQQAARVLKSGGALLAGLIQPVNYLFDQAKMQRGQLVVRFSIPYSDLDLPDDQREETLGPERPIDFGHSLSDLIGGQLDAGLQLTDMMEDRWGGDDPLSDKIATFMATRAVKPVF